MIKRKLASLEEKISKQCKTRAVEDMRKIEMMTDDEIYLELVKLSETDSTLKNYNRFTFKSSEEYIHLGDDEREVYNKQMMEAVSEIYKSSP